jgi:hypothetical protein
MAQLDSEDELPADKYNSKNQMSKEEPSPASGEAKTGSLKEGKGKGKKFYLANVIKEAKKNMQNEKSKNGITVALLGGSGRGKSTILRKIFIDDVYEGKDYIIHVSTESPTSDAFQKLRKDVLFDGEGVDPDTVHFCYKMNQEYDKKYNFVLVIDDCIHIKYIKILERMFLTMRNSNITSLVSIQHAKLIPPSIRNSIYFAICMGFNGEEGVEICVRTWLGGYLPGNSIMEKIYHYQQWAQDGHCFFMLDNLNHRCWKVDEQYMCEELFLQKRNMALLDEFDQSLQDRKRKRGQKEKIEWSEEEEEEKNQ